MTIIHEIIKHASKVIICFNVAASTLDIQSGANYLKTITAVQRLLSDQGLQNLHVLTLPLISQANNFRSSKQMHNKLKEPIDILTLKKEAIDNNDIDHQTMNIYQGDEFP